MGLGTGQSVGQLEEIRIGGGRGGGVQRVGHRAGALGLGVVGAVAVVERIEYGAAPMPEFGVSIQEGERGAIVVTVGGRVPEVEWTLVRFRSQGAVVYTDLVFLGKKRRLCWVE